mgnify:CR=1 FL=1
MDSKTLLDKHSADGQCCTATRKSTRIDQYIGFVNANAELSLASTVQFYAKVNHNHAVAINLTHF